MRYKKCPECGEFAVHLATASIMEFSGDKDDNAGNRSRYADDVIETDEISLFAHICFSCGHLVDVGIESPRDKAINTSAKE